MKSHRRFDASKCQIDGEDSSIFVAFLENMNFKNNCFIKTGGRFFQILWPSH